MKQATGNTGNPYLRVDNNGGSTLSAIGSAMAANSEWQRMTLTFTTPADVTSVFVRLHANGVSNAYWTDAVQLEQKGYATPYCDGGLGAGHSWDGTAHASTSSRTQGDVRYSASDFISASGTIAGWYYANNVGNYSGLWSVRTSSSDRLQLLVNGGDLDIYRNNGSGAFLVSGGDCPVGQWFHVAFTWTATEAKLYLNGVQTGSTYSGDAWSGITLSDDNFYIGNQVTDARKYWNGLIDDLFILSRAADADEIRAIYESNAPVFAESSTAFFKSYGPTPVEINDEGFWVEGPTVGAIFGIYGAASTKSWGGVTLSEGDILIGRSPAYALWDDSETKLKIGNVSSEHIAFDGSTVAFMNGATQMATLDGTTWVLGAVANSSSRIEITAGAVNIINRSAGGSDTTAISLSAAGAGSFSGAITAASGTVGGWTIGATTLTGTNVTLGSSGYATFGSGSNILKIDTTSPAELLWIGHATFASAPFRVSAAGAFTADNAAITTTNTGLHILDTNASHDLIIAPGSDLTADRTLTLTTGDANRTLTLTGNATLNQDVSTAGSPAFAGLTVDTNVLYVDAVNNRVGINKTPGAFDLDVYGAFNANSLKAVSGWVSSNWGVGLDASDPSWKFEVSGDSRFTGAIKLTTHLRMAETASTPGSLSSSAEGVLYVKSDKLVIAFNDAGTVRYKYLDLTGTGVTWVHTTTAP